MNSLVKRPESAPVTRGDRAIWWMNPVWIMASLMIPGYVAICATPEIFGWGAVVLKGFQFLTLNYFLLGLLFLAAMLNGAIIGRIRLGQDPDSVTRPPGFNRFYLDFLALATIVAYLIWFRGVFFSPSMWVTVFKGGLRISRSEHQTIGGLTTATQFGLAFIILYLTTLWGAERKCPARFKLYVAAILPLTIFRVFAWGERLAFAEVLVPIFLLYIFYRINSQRVFTRLALKILPLAGLFALLGYFGLTEYFRSWSAYYQFQHVSFWQFIIRRLTSYYYTSLNNGAGMLAMMDWPTWEMNYVLGWLHRFPLLIGASVQTIVDPKLYLSQNFLDRYADPEFNNPSGIFTVFMDVGLIGGLLVAVVTGVLAGVFYSSMRSGRGFGVVLYPLLFIHFIELFRYFYVGNQRAFPAIVALAIGYLFFRDKSTEPHESSRATLQYRDVRAGGP